METIWHTCAFALFNFDHVQHEPVLKPNLVKTQNSKPDLDVDDAGVIPPPPPAPIVSAMASAAASAETFPPTAERSSRLSRRTKLRSWAVLTA